MSKSWRFIFVMIIIAAVFPAAVFAMAKTAAPTKTAAPINLTATKTVSTKTISAPVRVGSTEIESKMLATAYIVIDKTSGKVLTEKNENLIWPIASLTKLMTAQILLSDKKVLLTAKQSVLGIDDVGGAKLYVKSGDKFTVSDLFYAMLVSSANNAANALARLNGVTRESFVKKMNAQAELLKLKSTKFVDPSGIGIENVSTVQEFLQIAKLVLKNPLVNKITTTSQKTIRVINTGATKKITNTNWMLMKIAYKKGIVTASKTGYLIESKWNFVTSLKPSTNESKKELLMVIFGSPSRSDSFLDAKRLAEWSWKEYEW